MASDNDLIIKITAETDRAIKEIKKLTTEVKKFSKVDDKSSKTISKNAKAVNTGFKTMGVSMGALVTSAAVLGIAMKALEFGALAADAEQSAEAFDEIFTNMGKNAEESFDKIRIASRGLVPDASIKQSAVTAVSLGVPIEKLAELMEVARVKALEMGTTTEAAFNDLATGIGRGSPMILDNLGLTIKIGDANEKMASTLGKSVEALTKQEKAMALTNAVIEAGASSVELFGDAQLTAKQKTQQFDTAIDNLKVKIGGTLLPAIAGLKKITADWINSFILDKPNEELDKLKDKLKEVGDSTKKEVKQTKKELGESLEFEFGAVFDGANVITMVDEAKKDIEGAGVDVVFRPKFEADDRLILNLKDEIDRDVEGAGKEIKFKAGLDFNAKNEISVINAKTLETISTEPIKIPAALQIDTASLDNVQTEVDKYATNTEVTATIVPETKQFDAKIVEIAKLDTTTKVKFEPLTDEVKTSYEYLENKTISIPVTFYNTNTAQSVAPPGASVPDVNLTDLLTNEIDYRAGE